MAYAELAALRPRAGGEYVYLRAAYGRLAGFLTGWTSFVAGFSGAIAAARRPRVLRGPVRAGRRRYDADLHRSAAVGAARVLATGARRTRGDRPDGVHSLRGVGPDASSAICSLAQGLALLIFIALGLSIGTGIALQPRSGGRTGESP